jgi:hypothetical protein
LSDAEKASQSVSRLVPNPYGRCWQRRGPKLGVMSKESLLTGKPGEGKIGRVNVSELLMRLR